MSHIPPTSFKVLTTLSAFRIVTPSTTTANAVIYPASFQDPVIGVTANDVVDTTSSIEVIGPGCIAKLEFNDTVGTGMPVAGDTNGKGIPAAYGALTTTAMTITGYVVGWLIGPAVSETGSVADVYVCPHQIRGTA